MPSTRSKSRRSHRPLILGLIVVMVMLGSGYFGYRYWTNPVRRKARLSASARQFAAKKDYRSAAIQYANALAYDRQDADLHFQLATAETALGNWRIAYSELLKTVELRPDHLQAQLDLGNLLLAARQFDQAKQRADLVLGRDPKSAAAHSLLANVALAKRDPDTALAEMNMAISLKPDDATFQENLAVVHAARADLKAAEDALKTAHRLAPASSSPVLTLGNLYERQERWEDAEKLYRDEIAAAPAQLPVRIALARLYLRRQRRGDAEQVVLQAKHDLAGNPLAYRSVGDFYVSVGELDKALAEFKSLYNEHPSDGSLKKSYMALLLARGDDTEARNLIDAILRKDSRDADALLGRAQLEAKDGKLDAAIQDLRQAIKFEPDNALAHYRLAVAVQANGDEHEARNELDEAVKINPNLADAHRALANLAARGNDAELMQSAGEQLIRILPFAADGYVAVASAAAMRGDAKAVEDNLHRALTLAPKDATGYAKLGGWRMQQKRYADAEKLFRDSLAVSTSPEALDGLAAALIVQKKTAEAVTAVQQVIAQNPGRAAFYVILGRVQLVANNPAAAEQSFAKAVSLDPHDAEAYARLAAVQIAGGRPDAASVTAGQWMQEIPRDVRAFTGAADIAFSTGNWKEAQRLYSKALEVRPDYPPAANNLAYILLENGGNVDMALSLAQTARSAMPRSANAADTLGWAYVKKGVYDTAIPLLEEASRQLPGNAAMHYHLAVAYEKTHDRDKARREYEKVLQVDPKFARADEVRRALQASY